MERTVVLLKRMGRIKRIRATLVTGIHEKSTTFTPGPERRHLLDQANSIYSVLRTMVSPPGPTCLIKYIIYRPPGLPLFRPPSCPRSVPGRDVRDVAPAHAEVALRFNYSQSLEREVRELVSGEIQPSSGGGDQRSRGSFPAWAEGIPPFQNISLDVTRVTKDLGVMGISMYRRESRPAVPPRGRAGSGKKQLLPIQS